MLPDGPSSSENIMSLPTDVNLHLSIVSPTTNNYFHNNNNNNNDNNSIQNQIQIDQIYPGIYLTNNDKFWTNDRLRSHGFTHIVIIDKHIHQNYTINILSQLNKFKMYNNNNHHHNNNNNNNDSNLLDANLPSSQYQQQHHQQPQQQQIVKRNTNNNTASTTSDISSNSTIINNTIEANNYQNIYNTNEFEILNLNFGEESYLTTVLPNCYKAVKFIDKALQYGGLILIIDYLNNQKCLTIVTAYLMYKNNLNFNDAFQRIKKYYQTAELDKFFISQLYEYEPILQVQRAQSKGHSCSRELRMAFLKRKKLHDDNLNTAAATTTASSSTATLNITTEATVIAGIDGSYVSTKDVVGDSVPMLSNNNIYSYNLNSLFYLTTCGTYNSTHDASDVTME